MPGDLAKTRYLIRGNRGRHKQLFVVDLKLGNSPIDRKDLGGPHDHFHAPDLRMVGRRHPDQFFRLGMVHACDSHQQATRQTSRPFDATANPSFCEHFAKNHLALNLQHSRHPCPHRPTAPCPIAQRRPEPTFTNQHLIARQDRHTFRSGCSRAMRSAPAIKLHPQETAVPWLAPSDQVTTIPAPRCLSRAGLPRFASQRPRGPDRRVVGCY